MSKSGSAPWRRDSNGLVSGRTRGSAGDRGRLLCKPKSAAFHKQPNEVFDVVKFEIVAAQLGKLKL
jgi:hypothetical protein